MPSLPCASQKCLWGRQFRSDTAPQKRLQLGTHCARRSCVLQHSLHCQTLSFPLSIQQPCPDSHTRSPQPLQGPTSSRHRWQLPSQSRLLRERSAHGFYVTDWLAGLQSRTHHTQIIQARREWPHMEGGESHLPSRTCDSDALLAGMASG